MESEKYWGVSFLLTCSLKSVCFPITVKRVLVEMQKNLVPIAILGLTGLSSLFLFQFAEGFRVFVSGYELKTSSFHL